MAIVMCKVSGGITGTRQSPLRDANGIVRFDSLEDAAKEAARLEAEANSRPFRTADFRYWPQASE